MRSFILRSLALPVALSVMSGCAFVQWTDHAFLGSPEDPPTHVDREWVGAVLLPLAAVGDIVTAPAQLVALLIVGDFGLYSTRNYSPYSSVQRGDERLVLDGTARETLAREIAARQASAPARGLVAYGVAADGTTTEVALTAEQGTKLLERAAN